MSVYIIPRGADEADDLIAQLVSFGEHVVNAAPEYKWAETWAAKLLIAEADEVVCLPHWDDYGFGQRDRELAVAASKPVYVAHRDGDKHGALWRLEYEEEQVQEDVIEIVPTYGAPSFGSWGVTGVTRKADAPALLEVVVAELRDAANERDRAEDMAAQCRSTLADAETLQREAWDRFDNARRALIAVAMAS